MNSLYGYIISNYTLGGTAEHIVYDILWYVSEMMSPNGEITEEGIDLIDMTICGNIGMDRSEIICYWED